LGVSVNPAVSIDDVAEVTTGTPAEVTVVGTTAEDCALATLATSAKSDNDLANMMMDGCDVEVEREASCAGYETS
jgi:hypothetical protein